MQKEIGSNFDLNPNIMLNKGSVLHIGQYGIKGSDEVILSTGRGAEGFVLDTIERRQPKIRKIALVPPFTCEVVIEPFVKRGYKIAAYPINPTLDIDENRFREILISSGAQVVLVHRYFGFDTLKGFEKIASEFVEQGVIFIEDRTQCLYSDFSGLPVDYTIGSLRKWAALPDGGFAVCREGVFEDKPANYDKELENKKLEASYLKYKYLYESKGEKKEFLKSFKEAEEILDAEEKYFRISQAGIEIQCSLNIEELKRKRRKNYEKLYENIRNHMNYRILTPQLNEKDVPLYLSILSEKRNELQIKMREQNIYAPIVWPKPSFMPQICKEAQEIYDTVLCFPIDQRYDEEDIERIAENLRKWG